jgi:hypothetical protein
MTSTLGDGHFLELHVALGDAGETQVFLERTDVTRAVTSIDIHASTETWAKATLTFWAKVGPVEEPSEYNYTICETLALRRELEADRTKRYWRLAWNSSVSQLKTRARAVAERHLGQPQHGRR